MKNGKIYCVTFSPDGKYLANSFSSKSINLVNVEEKRVIHNFDFIHKDDVRKLAFSYNKFYIASESGYRTVCLIDAYIYIYDMNS